MVLANPKALVAKLLGVLGLFDYLMVKALM
jgi:hypothetical protein